MEFRPPVVLEGRYISLVPLTEAQIPALHRAAQDPEIWRYLRYGDCTRLENLVRMVRLFLGRQAAGTDLPFAVLGRSVGRPIGMTRFMNIERGHESVEIGGTWYEREHRRTPANTESKYLLLRHAFDTEGCHRVQIKTDIRNEGSRAAIERLGAVYEGTLREHMVTPDGYRRSSAQYSILVSDWPAVRARLEAYLARSWSPPPSADSAPEPPQPAAARRP